MAALAIVGACSDDGDTDGAATSSTTSTTAADAELTATVRWATREITVRGDSPLDVAFCDGEAPLLCLTRAGEHLGVFELASFPAEGVGDLDEWARSFYESMAADRSAGCDPAMELDGDDPVAARLGRHDGVHYGYRVTLDGRVVERVVGYAAVVGDTRWVLVANSLGDDGCLSRESELPLDVVVDAEPLLDAVAAGSVLPSDTP